LLKNVNKLQQLRQLNQKLKEKKLLREKPKWFCNAVHRRSKKIKLQHKKLPKKKLSVQPLLNVERKSEKHPMLLSWPNRHRKLRKESINLQSDASKWIKEMLSVLDI
jgi:hypothetical protein